MDVCQSCGMPMEEEALRGKNKDGSLSDDYCTYCFPNGAFNNPNETFEEMVQTCIPFLTKEGFSEEEAREKLVSELKSLKRWA